MHSTDDKQAQASAPELDAQSVKDEAASQSAVNEQLSDAGNDEDQFYSILSKLKEAVDADRDTLEAALGKQGKAAADTTSEAADNEDADDKASDKSVESNDEQAASSGDAKASDSEASSKSAHVSTSH